MDSSIKPGETYRPITPNRVYQSDLNIALQSALAAGFLVNHCSEMDTVDSDSSSFEFRSRQRGATCDIRNAGHIWMGFMFKQN